MPKLLQINVCANWGSHGRIAEQIGNIALSQGWESYIAYGRYMNHSNSKLIKIGSKWDVYNHVALTRLKDKHGLGSKNSTKNLIKKIEEIKPDIIHLHNLHGYYINYKVLFDYLNSIDTPVVWTLHDCWTFTGHCAYFITSKCTKWKDNCGECEYKQSYPTAWVDDSYNNIRTKRDCFGRHRNMILITVSHWLENLVKESFLNKFEVKTIHNGTDLSVFSPRKMIDNKFVILGAASVWDSRKGLNDFIKLRKVLPESYIIKLIGLSKSQIKSLPVGIEAFERTDSLSQLAEMYSSASVFINPTYEDNFPSTNIEALASGTPVITYRTGGSIEAVSETTGFVVEQGDINGIIKAIEQIARVGKDIYSSACRKRAEEYFDMNEQYKKYFALYDTLLGSY